MRLYCFSGGRLSSSSSGTAFSCHTSSSPLSRSDCSLSDSLQCTREVEPVRREPLTDIPSPRLRPRSSRGALPARTRLCSTGPILFPTSKFRHCAVPSHRWGVLFPDPILNYALTRSFTFDADISLTEEMRDLLFYHFTNNTRRGFSL